MKEGYDAAYVPLTVVLQSANGINASCAIVKKAHHSIHRIVPLLTLAQGKVKKCEVEYDLLRGGSIQTQLLSLNTIMQGLPHAQESLFKNKKCISKKVSHLLIIHL